MTGEIYVAAVVVRHPDGRVLMVRKRGTAMFMFPGGKVEPGETSRRTAVRELAEEVGVVLDAATLVSLGTRLTDAANEPGRPLRADVYLAPDPVNAVTAQAEIAEAVWVDLADAAPEHLAPLTVALLPVLGSAPARGPLSQS